MKSLNIEFPLYEFQELINQIGWDTLDEWFKFWDSKKDILSIDKILRNTIRK